MTSTQHSEFSELAAKKAVFFKDVLQRIVLNVQHNKKLCIL